ncbi:hypothetical protein HGM15179_018733 [Zosterops borbonicus]|uniref:Uncharacterized protein n=1 Tax=Zosterops borbonicus TaxID=364589 RepID=A0A8K1DB43_9PASS|nr:hypothetical protein HGM15179_018732 [Zosterops borbonicus]TRZ08373.1 hypothetical protein HGM15179_018733 [Zosterops borbonicus]
MATILCDRHQCVLLNPAAPAAAKVPCPADPRELILLEKGPEWTVPFSYLKKLEEQLPPCYFSDVEKVTTGMKDHDPLILQQLLTQGLLSFETS